MHLKRLSENVRKCSIIIIIITTIIIMIIIVAIVKITHSRTKLLEYIFKKPSYNLLDYMVLSFGNMVNRHDVLIIQNYVFLFNPFMHNVEK